MKTRSRNEKSQGVLDTPLIPKMGKDEKALLETRNSERKVNGNIKFTNDRLDKIKM